MPSITRSTVRTATSRMPGRAAVGAHHAQLHQRLPTRLAVAGLAGEVVVERPAEDHGAERAADLAASPESASAAARITTRRRPTIARSTSAASTRRLSSLGPVNGRGRCLCGGVHHDQHRHCAARKLRRCSASSRPVERVAVIDMGSNSWRLVVFGYEPGTPWWSLVDEIREAVRIGAGMGDERSPAARARCDRALHTAAVFSAFCRATGVRAGRGRRDQRDPRRDERRRAARRDQRSAPGSRRA